MPGTTTDGSWAGPLAEMSQLSSAFVEMLRPRTVLGRLSGFRRVPFNVKFPRVTSGSSVGWVGQNRVTPVSSLALDQVTFKFSKIGGIVVISDEMARSADPTAEALIQSDLLASVAQFSDEQFLNPSIAAVNDVSPASITYGADEIASTGVTAAAVAADFVNLFAAIDVDMVAPFLIMRQSVAIFLATLRIGSGDRLFPDVGAHGGSIYGVPVIVSGNTPMDGNSPGDHLIVLLDAGELLLAEGDVVFDSTNAAIVQMDSSPDSPPTASTTLVSLFQHGLLGLKAIRLVRWQMIRSGAVAYLSGVAIP